MRIKCKLLLYVEIKRALYGLLRSVLIFYRNVVKDIEAHRLHINPYDPCVANKMISKKLMTVVWHLDELKVSHVNRFEETKF